jgi:hypothetical protein
MDRSSLLLAIARAASAAALRQDDATEQRKLDGKRFEVRIRFGCAPPTLPVEPAQAAGEKRPTLATPTGPFNVRFDEEDRTLRIRATPDLTLDEQPVKAIAGETVEAVEGFWMYRPWLLTDGCPVVASPPEPQTPTESPESGQDEPSRTRDTADASDAELKALPERNHRVGLAQFFTKTDPRTGRRDERPYETTKVLPQDKQPSRQGYNLVLSGRLRNVPVGRVINCRVASLNSPPECIVSAEFDRVWVEEPGTKEVIAEWSR